MPEWLVFAFIFGGLTVFPASLVVLVIGLDNLDRKWYNEDQRRKDDDQVPKH